MTSESEPQIRVSGIGTMIYIHTNGRTIGITYPEGRLLVELLTALFDSQPKLEDL